MDATKDFFNNLRRSGHQPLLRKTSGSVRFDLADGDGVESWYLTVKRGSIAVSHKKTEADAVVSCDKALFNRMIRGEANAMAAALRGLIVAQGDLGLVLSVARLFRGATDARPAVPTAGYAKRQS
jgi:putative sterol carrier protein